MKLQIDLHVHTIYSKDSLIEIEDLVARCRATGLDGVAITDHDTLEGGLMAAERCQDILVIPGMEVETHEGHLLALDVTRPVEGGLGFKDTIERIGELGGTVVVAHPCSLLKPLIDVDVLKVSKPDAIEVANASSVPYSWMLKINRAIAEKLNLPMTGGSDAHIPETIGRSYTIVDSDSREVSDVLEAIKEGRTEVYGSGVTLQERFSKIFRKGIRR